MDGDFGLNKGGYYTPQTVETNKFLNDKLENDNYGLWYSVKFHGDANTHLWQTKTKPVENQKYYGMIIMTSSGKSTKFKKLPDPGATQSPSKGSEPQSRSNDYWDDKDARIQAQWALGRAYEKHGAGDKALSDAEWLFAQVDKVKLGTPGYNKAQAVAQDLKPDPDYDPGEDPGNYEI